MSSCSYTCFEDVATTDFPPAVKTSLEVASAFMILGVIATFVALVLYFPLWHWVIFIFGACAAVASGGWQAYRQVDTHTHVHFIPVSIHEVESS